MDARGSREQSRHDGGKHAFRGDNPVSDFEVTGQPRKQVRRAAFVIEKKIVTPRSAGYALGDGESGFRVGRLVHASDPYESAKLALTCTSPQMVTISVSYPGSLVLAEETRWVD